jgi:type 1 fimbria pilin
MKNRNFISGHSLALRVSLGLFLPAVTFGTPAADVQFSATFQAPTCQVSAPAALDFGVMLSSDIRQGVSLADPLPLEISLSQCGGFIGAVQRPGVTVTGTGNTASGDFLFRQATSQAVNYGVRIATAAGEVVADNTFIPVRVDSSDFNGTGITTIPLKVALSCGSQCASAATKSGTLNASVTFDFSYQ